MRWKRTVPVQKPVIWQFPHLILGVLTLFFYVGAEVIAGDAIIRYGMSLGIEISKAKVFTSYTLVSMTAGYILGIILIPKVISQRIALMWCGILGIIFLLGAVFTSGLTSVFFIAILGFANALVWPAIWPLAIHNLGKFIKTGLCHADYGHPRRCTASPLLWENFLTYMVPNTHIWSCYPAISCLSIILSGGTRRRIGKKNSYEL